jgi:ATP/maltotriose-dependent transcriptional regulator MalT
MPHTDLRELAFQMRSDELRKYAKSILDKDPTRIAAAEVLDLMGYLIECDFVGAEAKLSTINYRFRGSKDQIYVNEATSLAKSHIDFAFGRFNELEQSANTFLEHHSHLPSLEEGELLDVLRLLAQKALILDENDKLEEIFKQVIEYETEENSVNKLYLINSVYAMYLLIEGDFYKTQEVALRNIQIAKQNGYSGLMAPIDSLFVLACVKGNLSQQAEAEVLYKEVMSLGEKFHQWPWYFMAEGIIAKSLAHAGKITESLAIVREQRQKLNDFSFKHDLNFIPDVNELYSRYLIKDIDRIETLLTRVPNLVFVNQLKALVMEWQGQDMIKWIEALPEKTNREKIYKFIALAEYYQDKESIAVEYMAQALELIERTGSVEAIIRQHALVDIVMKAISKNPTVFLENLASKMAEQMSKNNNNQEGMPVPLTSRELEVIRHLATGKPISAISNLLHVSMNTMKTHLRNIYRKLEVDGREKAVEKAKALFLI